MHSLATPVKPMPIKNPPLRYFWFYEMIGSQMHLTTRLHLSKTEIISSSIETFFLVDVIWILRIKRRQPILRIFLKYLRINVIGIRAICSRNKYIRPSICKRVTITRFSDAWAKLVSTDRRVYQAESPDIAPRYKFRRIYFQRTRYTDIYLIHTLKS